MLAVQLYRREYISSKSSKVKTLRGGCYKPTKKDIVPKSSIIEGLLSYILYRMHFVYNTLIEWQQICRVIQSQNIPFGIDGESSDVGFWAKSGK